MRIQQFPVETVRGSFLELCSRRGDTATGPEAARRGFRHLGLLEAI